MSAAKQAFAGIVYEMDNPRHPRPPGGEFILGWCTKGKNGILYPSVNIYIYDTAARHFRMRDFPKAGPVKPDLWALVPPFEVKSWPGRT